MKSKPSKKEPAPRLEGRMMRTVRIDMSRAIISKEERHEVPDFPGFIVATYFRDYGWKAWSKPFPSKEAAEARIKEMAANRDGLPPTWLRVLVIGVDPARA